MQPTALLAMSRERFEDVCSEADAAWLATHFSLAGPFDSTPTADQLRSGIEGATAVFTSWGTPPLDPAALAAAPHLRVVAHAAGTIRHLVPQSAFDRGIGVFSAGPRIADSVAEYVLTAILTLSRRLPAFDASVRSGSWVPQGVRGRELRGARIGLIGASSTARALLRLLAPFEPDVHVYDPYLSEEQASVLGVRQASLSEALTSPVVSVHVPSTPETEGMITAELLSRVPDGAIFINSSRGSVVDQTALFARIAAGTLNAALDVFETEPASIPSDIVDSSNAVLTPHIAGDTVEGHRALLGVVARDAVEWLRSGATGSTWVDAARLAVSA